MRQGYCRLVAKTNIASIKALHKNIHCRNELPVPLHQCNVVVTFVGEREFVETALSEDVEVPGLPDTAGASRGEADVVHLVVLHTLRPQRRQRARAADHHHLCVANGFDFL